MDAPRGMAQIIGDFRHCGRLRFPLGASATTSTTWGIGNNKLRRPPTEPFAGISLRLMAGLGQRRNDPMKAIIAGAGLALMLLTPGAFAQQQAPQSQQQTDEQKNLNNNVQAQPSTKKREDIIRSESGQPDNKATVGTGSEKKQ
jgi:hypothetical protein